MNLAVPVGGFAGWERPAGRTAGGSGPGPRLPARKGLAVSLGENIKRLRTVAGIQTQKAFAELLGVQQPQVSGWENDRYPVLEVSSLIRLAKALHLLSGRVARRCRPGLRPDPGGRRGWRGPGQNRVRYRGRCRG